MYEKTMDERVTALEQLAESLSPLPAQMAEMNGRMTNVEGRLVRVDGRLDGVEGRLGNVESQIVQLRDALDVRTSEILEVIDSASKATQTMHEEVIRTVKEGDEETRRQMRVLHEDLVERIGRIGESRQ